jgi:hypothetical protein
MQRRSALNHLLLLFEYLRHQLLQLTPFRHPRRRRRLLLLLLQWLM